MSAPKAPLCAVSATKPLRTAVVGMSKRPAMASENVSDFISASEAEDWIVRK